jgi:uncharacterized membrane protein
MWNLWLAWMPLLFAISLGIGMRRQWPRLPILALAIAWLIFLPNASYIVTDFVHVGDSSSALADLALIACFSVNGLALGFASLMIVQRVVARRFNVAMGWIFGLGAIVLSGVGVYLGRVHRLNSWDALLDPANPVLLVGERLAEPLTYPAFYAALAVYTFGIAAVYLLVRRLSVLRVDEALLD